MSSGNVAYITMHCNESAIMSVGFFLNVNSIPFNTIIFSAVMYRSPKYSYYHHETAIDWCLGMST